MNVWLKRGLFGLVIALIVALVGLAVFLLTFNPNAYKSRLEDLVFARYGRTLVIDGDIGLSLFPRIGLSVRDVSLSDRDRDSLFLSVDSARFAVAIWPLLSHQLVVDHVAISGLKAWVVRDRNGRFNFDDLLAAAAPPSPAEPAGGSLSVPGSAVAAPVVLDAQSDLSIDIAGLDLKGGQIQYLDERSGLATTLANIEANTGRVTFDQAFDVSLKAVIQGDDPVQDAKLETQALLRLDPGNRQYAAQKVNVGLTGRLGNLTDTEAQLKGNMAYDARARRFSADGLELSISGDVTGAHPVADLETRLTADKLHLDLSSTRLNVSRLALRSSGVDAGRKVELALDAPALSLSPEAASADPVAGTLKWEGAETLATSLKLEGLSGNANEWQFRSVTLDGALRQGRRMFRLQLMSPLNWSTSLRKGALTAIKGDIGVQDERLPDDRYEAPMIGSLHLDLVRDTLDADLSAVFDGGQASLKTQVTRLADPQLRFSLNMEKLDLNRWLPVPVAAESPDQGDAGRNADAEDDGKTADKSDAGQGESDAGAAPTAIDLSFLKGKDIRGDFNIGDLRLRDVQLKRAGGQVEVRDGRLTVSALDAQLYEGTLKGELTAAADQTFGARLKLDQVAVAPLLQATAGSGLISGKGAARFDLASAGDTLDAIERGLSGQVEWQIRKGAVHGIDAARTLSEVSAALGNVVKGRLDAVPSPFGKGRSTPFSQLDARIDLDKGQGTVHKLAFVSDLVRVSEGRPAVVDIPGRQIDLMLKVRVNARPPAGAVALGPLLGATVPVRISGAWTDPAFGVLWDEVSNPAVQRALRSGLMELMSGDDPIQRALGATLHELGSETEGEAPPADKQRKAGDPVGRLGDALKGFLKP